MRDFNNKAPRKIVRGLFVEVQGDNVEKALRKFKKMVIDSGLMQDLRARETYEKPTTERRRKKLAAKARWRKTLSSQKLPTKMF